eukprot:402510-Amphidinium_carterae.2
MSPIFAKISELLAPSLEHKDSPFAYDGLCKTWCGSSMGLCDCSHSEQIANHSFCLPTKSWRSTLVVIGNATLRTTPLASYKAVTKPIANLGNDWFSSLVEVSKRYYWLLTNRIASACFPSSVRLTCFVLLGVRTLALGQQCRTSQ